MSCDFAAASREDSQCLGYGGPGVLRGRLYAWRLGAASSYPLRSGVR
jgi:hypothetical protein